MSMIARLKLYSESKERVRVSLNRGASYAGMLWDVDVSGICMGVDQIGPDKLDKLREICIPFQAISEILKLG